MIIHILWHGITICGRYSGGEKTWPLDHKWVGLPEVEENRAKVEKQATWCPDCITEYNKSKEKDHESDKKQTH